MNWPEDAAEVIERCRGLDGEIQLQRRGDDFEIIYNGVFLMSTYNGASEKAAVSEALKSLTEKNNHEIKVLIGGLGMGYSLQEALKSPLVSLATVVEYEPAVIRWNFDFFSNINGYALYDKRTDLINKDFREVLKNISEKSLHDEQEKYHLIMVDTDNGSTWLSRASNSFFYNHDGLNLINSCLFSGGLVSFWCSNREESFEMRLKQNFSPVRFHKVMEITGKEGCYYIATKP